MNNDYNSKGFKAWLDKLQQESWQLELIISGFAIYGLFQVFDPLSLELAIAENEEKTVYIFVLITALNSCSILAFTLLIHVILRGLWIGALGLRYVSGDIEYEKLNYSPKFDKFLRRRIGSFDKYIAKLEDYCSIIFAVSFLLIFYFFSFIITSGAIGTIGYFVGESERNIIITVISVLFILLIVFGMLLTFIDFLTQGYLKKKKWLSKLYFPFYRLFSILTLSFLYRPLVYNFLDNKLGKRISYILIPCYIAITIISAFGYNRSNYLSLSENQNSVYFSSKKNYEEFLNKEKDFINDASIPSKVIEKSYLKLFIEYGNTIEDDIFNYNVGLKPEEDKRGIELTDISVNFGNVNREKKDSLRIEYFKTFKEIHTIKIDTSVFTNVDFILTKNKQNQLGFETVIDIKDLKAGKHILEIKRLRKRRVKKRDTFKNRTIATIPFWYYPD